MIIAIIIPGIPNNPVKTIINPVTVIPIPIIDKTAKKIPPIIEFIINFIIILNGKEISFKTRTNTPIAIINPIIPIILFCLNSYFRLSFFTYFLSIILYINQYFFTTKLIPFFCDFCMFFLEKKSVTFTQITDFIFILLFYYLYAFLLVPLSSIL